MTAEECEAEASRCVARGDGVGEAIWRARAACTRNGKILPNGRGWLARHEEEEDARQDLAPTRRV